MEVLKMDMANFTIQQIRPFVQQQSVDYEKKKFEDLIKQQAGLYISFFSVKLINSKIKG